MDRREYTDAVLACLRRVTEAERTAIRRELEDHIVDHASALEEAGYTAAEAEERALAAMGDPAETGRALNEQYTGWGWVLLRRAAMIAVALTLVMTFTGWRSFLGNTLTYARTRLWPESYVSVERMNRHAERIENTDLRLELDGAVLQVWQVGLQDPADPLGSRAYVMVRLWSDIPWEQRSLPWIAERVGSDMRGAIKSDGDYDSVWGYAFEALRGESVEITTWGNGWSGTLTVSLPWEEAAE